MLAVAHRILHDVDDIFILVVTKQIRVSTGATLLLRQSILIAFL